jgi:hypothetical protein
MATELKVSVDHLISGQTNSPIQRNVWGPKRDEVDVILSKLRELGARDEHSVAATAILPVELLANEGMVASFVDSTLDGASPIAAERWHDLIVTVREARKAHGLHNVAYMIPLSDLLRLPRREPPYQAFSDAEVVHLLDHLKHEWVLQCGLRIIAVADEAMTAEMNLELAANHSLGVMGRRAQIRCRKDMRADWDEDPAAVRFSRDSLLRLKRLSGFRVRERPSSRHVEHFIDELLRSMASAPGPSALPRRENGDSWALRRRPRSRRGG